MFEDTTPQESTVETIKPNEETLNVRQLTTMETWDFKYRFKHHVTGEPIDNSLQDTWWRIAKALADNETDKTSWAEKFYSILEDFKFIPGGRIIAGSGTGRNVTLLNCFMSNNIPDSLDGIFDSLKNAALTMQQGGGIGMNFSTIRYKGAPVHKVGSDASGPISFMDVWSSMCTTIESAGTRRGAMMGTMMCNHPDIFDFIKAKRDPNRLRSFNLSVLVTDDFMTAVKNDSDWDLVWQSERDKQPQVIKTIKARELWDAITRSTYEYADPGVLFIDRINKMNNLYYCETIVGSNPCGEIPLPQNGACLLGSINLTKFIIDPFTDEAAVDTEKLVETVGVATRLMDNVIDVSNYPLEQQKLEHQSKRRLGMGTTGLADALAMLQLKYGSSAAAKAAADIMKTITVAAYKASVDLAKEKGSFPLYDKEKFAGSPFVKGLPKAVREYIYENGIRNSHLTSIAPTGTISMLAGNISSGLEPIFAFGYDRKITQKDGSKKTVYMEDYAVDLFREINGRTVDLPDYFVTSNDLTVEEHLKMQSTLQRWVDQSQSKTINIPVDYKFEDFQNVYVKAYETGCKGCTTYRPNDITGSILSVKTDDKKPQKEFKMPRPEVLDAKIYKFKFGDIEHAYYISISDIIEDNKRRPFEMFINSKNVEHMQWISALTRMVSAIFRRGGDISFVSQELKEVFDPNGGAFVPEKGYVKSVVAMIGSIVERHIDWCERQNDKPGEASSEADEAESLPIEVVETKTEKVIEKAVETAETKKKKRKPLGLLCNKCSEYAMVNSEGCSTCKNCGYSKCS